MSEPAQPATSRTAPPGTAKNVATYLKAVRALMDEAVSLRRFWIRQVGVLILEARTEPPDTVAPRAAHCGEQHREHLTGVRDRLQALPAPVGTDACHEAFLAWLDRQLHACTLLEEVGRTGDLAGLRTVQRVVAEGRGDTAAFAAAYAALVSNLKARVAARGHKRSADRRDARP